MAEGEKESEKESVCMSERDSMERGGEKKRVCVSERETERER